MDINFEDDFYALQNQKKRDSFVQDGIRAWKEYQATGLHITSEEADEWLTKLAEGQDMEPPKRHSNLVLNNTKDPVL